MKHVSKERGALPILVVVLVVLAVLAAGVALEHLFDNLELWEDGTTRTWAGR